MVMPDKQAIIVSFDKISQFPDDWDQNRFYENLLLKYVPKNCQNALDIGCGTGEFTRRLARIAQKVTAIDISEKMVQGAQKRSFAENIVYQAADFEEFKTQERFDLIVSIAAFHHLDLEKALEKIKSLLTKNGTLIVLDLYDRSRTFWAVLDFIALTLNSFFLKTKRRQNPVSKEETAAWLEHKYIDQYLTLKEIKKICVKRLGKFKIKRLIFWRYLLVYKKAVSSKDG